MPVIMLAMLLLGDAPVSSTCDVEQAIAASRRAAMARSYSSDLEVGAFHGPMRWHEFASLLPYYAGRVGLKNRLELVRFYYVLLVPVSRPGAVSLGGFVAFVDKTNCEVLEGLRER